MSTYQLLRVTDESFSSVDQQMMAAALALAEKGRYTTMPNPRVGCVLTHSGEIVGQGWHRFAGQPHAEIYALEQAGDRAKGATAYVTLEPCSHRGRTGPCVDALINAGVKRVVFAMQDPNPQVAGRGADRLAEAGIEVQSGLLQDQSEALNRGFIKRMQNALPFVNAKAAMSLDGRTAMASGESQWITGPQARQKVQQIRAQSCAIVTGVGTVLQDDPALTVRAAELTEEVHRQPLLVIVDSHLKTPLDAKVIQQSVATGRNVLLASTSQSDADRRQAFERLGVQVACFDGFKAGNPCVDLQQLLQHLGSTEINELMLEAGAVLLGSFIEQQLLDELQLFIAPKLLGSTARPLAGLALNAMSEAYAVNVLESTRIGEDWLFRCTFQPE